MTRTTARAARRAIRSLAFALALAYAIIAPTVAPRAAAQDSAAVIASDTLATNALPPSPASATDAVEPPAPSSAPLPAPSGPRPYALTGDRLSIRNDNGAEIVRFDGHVVFHSGATLVRADWGEYTSADRAARFGGRVEIFHEGSLLLGPLAVLHESDERLEFPSGVIVLDDDRTLLARSGLFDLQRSTGSLWDEAAVIDGPRSIEADSIDLVSDSEARAHGHVLLRDSEERTRVTGDEAILTEGRTRVTGAPRLLRFDTLGEVEAKIESDTLTFGDGGGLEATGRVRVDQQGTTALAERAEIGEGAKRAKLAGAPRVEKDGQTLTGDEMTLVFADSELREVLAEGGARMTRDDDVTGDDGAPERERATAEGDTIRLEVEADSLRRAVVWGDVRSTTERSSLSGELLEKNDVLGDSLVLDTAAGEADRVRVIGRATGRYSPRETTAPAPSPALADSIAPETLGLPPDSSLTAATDSTAATRPDSVDAVIYSADTIEFRTGDRRIVLTGAAKLDYQGMTLNADTVVYDLDRAVLNATGVPKLRQGGEDVTGERMGYSLEDRKGIVYGGETTYQTGRLRGGEVVRLDNSTLDVRDGVYTSCDQKPPHFHFESKLMRVYLDDKSVARPVVLFIHDIPVIGLPFYVLPLTRERRSGFLLPAIEFGFSDRRGRFVRNLGYYWATNDYVDFTGWTDIYQNERWTGHLDMNYAVRYLLNGSISSSYSRETSTLGGGRRWDLQASHRQELGDRATLTARADFVSDATYRRDQGTTVDDLNRQLKSDATFQKSWTSQSITLSASRLEKLDRGDISEQLPRLSYSRQRFPIFGGSTKKGDAAPWYGTTYLGVSGNLINAREKRVDQTTLAVTETNNFATEGTFSLSNSMKLFGWLGLSPSADYREALFNKDKTGKSWQERGVWSARAAANTNLYGTWWPRLGPVVGVRHIMTPSVSFGYSPEFNQYLIASDAGVPNAQDLFPSVSGIGGTPRGSQSLGISVQHTFQLKLNSGGKERSIDDLLIIGQSLSRDIKRGGKSWSNLSSSVRLRPARRYDVNVSMTHDLYDLTIESASIQNQLSLDGSMFARGGDEKSGAPADSSRDDGYDDTDADAAVADAIAQGDLARGQAGRERQRGPWRLGFSHSFSKSRSGTRADHRISSNLSTTLTDKWYFDYAPFFDLREREVISQSFTLIRDLHCWEASFRGRYDGSGWEYFFKINIRAHAEVGYELGRKVF
ncbi:MAG: putative LPS assembly protein LptD [bacterium]